MTTLSSSNQTATAANPYRSAYFVTVTFSTYTLRMWSGVGPRDLSGDTYVGAGALGSVTMIPETLAGGAGGLDSSRVELMLTGLDTSLATEVRDFSEQGASVDILEAQLDSSDALVDGTYSLWSGQVDTMHMQLGETLTVRLVCENFLAWLFRGPDGRRETNQDQQDLFSGDKFFEFTARMPDTIPWGVATNSQGSSWAASGPNNANRLRLYRPGGM